jgi:antitoxin (DNA-binding transcriptional repressor) of toxin-antitoxin stability system
MPFLLAALLLQAAAPAALVAQGDWITGCDNQRACQALAGASGGAEPRLRLVLRRDGAADAATRLDLPLPVTVAAGSRVTLAVDGRTIAQLVAPGNGGGLALPFEGKLAAALLRGRRVTVVAPRRRVLAGASLVGLETTLRAFDAAQGRTGGATALAPPARGDLAAAIVPPVLALPVLALPVVDQPEVTGATPRRFSEKDARKLLGRDAGTCAAPQTWRLDAAYTLLAFDPACAALHGAGALYLLPAKGQPRVASIDVPPPDGVALWDVTRRRLIGASGPVRREYAWDGTRFRLVLEQHDAALPDAIGDEDTITTWRATVAVH